MILNELLQDKKMTKYRLSKISGVPQTTINDICSGKAKLEKCAVGTLYKIARALDVTLDSMVEAQMRGTAVMPGATTEDGSKESSAISAEADFKTSPDTIPDITSATLPKATSEKSTETISEKMPKVQQEVTTGNISRKVPEVRPEADITGEIPALSSAAEGEAVFRDFRNAICQQVRDMGDLDFILTTRRKDEVRKLYQQNHLPEALYLLAMLDYLSRENDLPLYTNYNDIRRQKLAEPTFPAVAEGELTAQYKAEALENAIPEFLRFQIVEVDVREMQE